MVSCFWDFNVIFLVWRDCVDGFGGVYDVKVEEFFYILWI